MKDKEKKLAYEYYVNQRKTAKQAAEQAGVSERTIGIWVEKENWKKLREAKINSKNEQIKNIREIISILSEERIKLYRDISAEEKKEKPNKTELEYWRKRAVEIADEISKWNKTLLNFDKENRISLSVYLEIMNDIFENLRAFDEKLYSQTFDFQQQHLSTVSMKF